MSWSNENKSCMRVEKREFVWVFFQLSCLAQTRTKVAWELTSENLYPHSNNLPVNICFTADWQKSKSASTPITLMFFASMLVICCRWIELIPCSGYNTITETFSQFWNPCNTALPVSPDVATNTKYLVSFSDLYIKGQYLICSPSKNVAKKQYFLFCLVCTI